MANNNSSQERISQKLSSPSETKRKKSTIIIVISIGIVFLALIAVILILAKPESTPKARNVVVTPENVDEILENLKEQKTPADQYEVTMNSNWEFDDGASASTNAYVGNAATNNNDVYFDVIRSDTNETILKSPIIPVGSHLEGITLDTKLSAGNYKCIMTYHLLDDSGESISTVNINLNINVKN